MLVFSVQGSGHFQGNWFVQDRIHLLDTREEEHVMSFLGDKLP